MRPPVSSSPMFGGSRPHRRGGTPSGRPLVPTGVHSPPVWAWFLVGLAALAAAVLIAGPGASAPGPPHAPGLALAAPRVSSPTVPGLGAPSIDGPSLPGVGAPSISAPQVRSPHLEVPDLHVPEISPPHLSGPHISAPDVGTPHIGRPDLNVHVPAPPDLHGPSFHFSLGWLFDLFAIWWDILIFFIRIPWWLILLAILFGGWLWLLSSRRKESDEEAGRS